MGIQRCNPGGDVIKTLSIGIGEMGLLSLFEQADNNEKITVTNMINGNVFSWAEFKVSIQKLYITRTGICISVRYSDSFSLFQGPSIYEKRG